MTTDPLTRFHVSFVEQVQRRKDTGEFLRLLQEREPGSPYGLLSEASGLESLLSFGLQNPVITKVETRRAATIVDALDLLDVEEPEQPLWTKGCVETLLGQIREQMAPQPPPPSPEADPDRNPMWQEWTTNKHYGTLASRTFVRDEHGGNHSVLQDRLTVTVAIPDLRLVVFAALIWERITASK